MLLTRAGEHSRSLPPRYLAIFLTVGIFFYGVDIKQLKKEIEDTKTQIENTHADSQRLELSIKQAKLDLDQDSAALKKDVDTAEASAKEAAETSARARTYLQDAEQSKEHIQQYELTLIALPPGSKLPSGPPAPQPNQSNSDQSEHAIDLKLLDYFKDILPPEKYAALKGKILTSKEVLRLQVFDAKNTEVIPGDLVRKVGDPPVSDTAANEVYENIQTVYRFFKEVFDRESIDNHGRTLVATIHYSKGYDNAFWNGQQLIFGDGDGQIFRKFHRLPRHHRPRADHWRRPILGETPVSGSVRSVERIGGRRVRRDGEAVGAWADGRSGGLAHRERHLHTRLQGTRVARYMANPGTAYDDPVLGKDPQPGHMKDYRQTQDDNGGVHINCGIPSRAFVLAARANWRALLGKGWKNLVRHCDQEDRF